MLQFRMRIIPVRHFILLLKPFFYSNSPSINSLSACIHSGIECLNIGSNSKYLNEDYSISAWQTDMPSVLTSCVTEHGLLLNELKTSPFVLCACVHSQRDPHLGDACSSECHNNGNNIHCQLELQELGDAVVNISAPHDSLHNAAEVVISQDNVRGFLCHISASNAL